MPDQAPPLKKPSRGILKTADRYEKRLADGDMIMRDANGRMQWASGKSVGATTVRYMIDAGRIFELDADLFGRRDFGQTIGRELPQ